LAERLTEFLRHLPGSDSSSPDHHSPSIRIRPAEDTDDLATHQFINAVRHELPDVSIERDDDSHDSADSGRVITVSLSAPDSSSARITSVGRIGRAGRGAADSVSAAVRSARGNPTPATAVVRIINPEGASTKSNFFETASYLDKIWVDDF